MGTFSPAIGHPVRTAALIGAEDEAIGVAASAAAAFEPAVSGQSPKNPQARLELLGRSGLFGVSVPTEHGGIDVSNTVLADICAIASERSATLGEILAAHFVAIEHLRSHGSEAQQTTLYPAALTGARLAMATPVRRDSEEAGSLPLLSSGVGWRLGGELLCTPCTRHSDWVMVPTRTDAGRSAMLILPTGTDGLHYVANSCEPSAAGASQPEHVLVKDVLADGSALLHAAAEGTHNDVPQALDLLLRGALHLGAGRRALQAAFSAEDPDPVAIGSASVRLTAAAAAIEQAGRAIDAAQIGLAEQNRTNAFLASAAACMTALDAVRQAAPGGSASRLGDPEPQDADLLREIGTLRLEAHRHPPEAD